MRLRNWINRTGTAPFLLVLAAFPASLAADTAYSFTQLDFPGATSTYIAGINDAGQIVGSYTNASTGVGVTGNFLYSSGNFVPLDLPGTVAGINNVGQIFGTSESIGSSSGFIYSGGTLTPFNVPASLGTATQITGVNDIGQTIGTYNDGYPGQGFLYSGGVFTSFGVLPGSPPQGFVPYGINDAGQIVGQTLTMRSVPPPPPPDSYLFSDGAFSEIFAGGPLTHTTLAVAINNAGQIVGSYEAFGPSGGFLYSNGASSDIGVLLGKNPTGINDLGQIVGNFGDATGAHGFLLTPAPEPGTLGIFAVLLTFATVRVARRK